MLLNDFFYIQGVENSDKSLKASILINKSHKIFEGHFPEIPIVPGVCMMQMMKEIMEQQLKRKLVVREGDNMKFLSVINPTENSLVQADIQYDDTPTGVKINATLLSGATTFFKLKATLQSA